MELIKAKAYAYCGADLECKVICFSIDGGECTEYTTYGIRVTDSFGDTLYERPDISTDKAFVEAFASLCETHYVSIVHMDDILEDYLT